MKLTTDVSIDDFPCGCIVADASRRVLYASQYLNQEFGWDLSAIQGQRMEDFMSPASHLFCESYVYPLLLQTGKCEEVQLTLVTPTAARVPIIANARQAKDDTVVWSIFSAQNRDKLYQELVEARNQLEEQSNQLRRLAATDELTGLMNRRAFNETTKKAFAASMRTGDPITLMLLDIDNFKMVNDTYGHEFGDDVLRKIGACLADTCRSSETVARFGGEEFVFLLRGEAGENAPAFAARVHDAIGSALKDTLPTTVSIGVALRSGHFGPTYIELLNLADKALYQAKDCGKNRTVVSEGIDRIDVA